MSKECLSKGSNVSVNSKSDRGKNASEKVKHPAKKGRLREATVADE